jgi:hypothetical protein
MPACRSKIDCFDFNVALLRRSGLHSELTRTKNLRRLGLVCALDETIAGIEQLKVIDHCPVGRIKLIGSLELDARPDQIAAQQIGIAAIVQDCTLSPFNLIGCA